MKKPKRAHITRYGEGSFKYNEKRDLWVGRYDTGQLTDRGTRLIITASARNEDEAWQKFVAAKKDFMLNGPKLPEVKAGMTVKRWAAEWLPVHEKNVRSSTYKQDRTNVTKWIIPAVGNARLDQLTAAHMRKVGDDPKRAGRSGSTSNSAQRTLTKLLNAAKADGYNIPDRVFAAKKVGVGTSTRTRMSKDEVRATFTHAYRLYPDAVRMFIAVLYGARKGEVLGLEWDRITYYKDVPAGSVVVGEIDLSWQVQPLRYIDRERQIFHVADGEEVRHIVDSWHFTRPKTDSGDRILPLIAPVALALEKWREQCPKGDANPWNLVFPRIRGLPHYRGYPRNRKTDSDEWYEAQRLAGVEKAPGQFYMMHEARHSMISMLADEQVPAHVIEALVGQSELVGDYVHGELAAAGDAVGLLADLLPPGLTR